MRLGLGLGIPGTSGLVQAAFSPLDLSPVLWLDASDTSTITESGGAVSQWDDKSGNGNDVAQGTAAAQPKSGTATINGLNVIEFDGANTQSLKNASLDLFSVAYTSFAVVQINAADTSWAFRAASASQNGVIGYCISGSTSPTLAVNATGTITYYANGVLFTGTQRTQLYAHVGTGSPVIARANDATQVTYNGFSIGVQGDNGQFGQGSLVAEYILVASSGLTTDEITATETYLADKWGITL